MTSVSTNSIRPSSIWLYHYCFDQSNLNATTRFACDFVAGNRNEQRSDRLIVATAGRCPFLKEERPIGIFFFCIYFLCITHTTQSSVWLDPHLCHFFAFFNASPFRSNSNTFFLKFYQFDLEIILSNDSFILIRFIKNIWSIHN